MIVRTARSRADLERVWHLTHDVYVSEGYAQPRTDGLLRHYPQLDEIDETEVFLAEEDGKLAGTISLTVDGPAGLQGDEDFPEAVDQVRQRCRRRGQRLGASWRIVTDPEHRGRRGVVMALIDAYCQEIATRGLDVTLYSLNPKHQRFYRHLLDFETIAGPVPGRAVASAPAVLMRGELPRVCAAWARQMPRAQPVPANPGSDGSG